MNSSSLHRLLYPRSIAVIGGTAAGIVIEKTRALGFEGPIYAVNPKLDELAGVRCVDCVEALPEVPDACFVGVSVEASIVAVNTLAGMGAGGVVCYASGYAELDEAGQEKQLELLAAAQSGAEPMALIGPNCHGVLNFLNGSALWPDQHGGVRVASGVALVVQSGNIGISLTYQQRGLPLAHMITVGNGAQIGSAKIVDELLNDPHVTAIGIHMEGLGDVQEWSRVALRAHHKKIPLVVLKTGASNLGAELALSHSGSLNSSDRLVDEFFRRFGIARCHTLSEFLETLKLLHFGGPIHGTEISSMSCSGGEASHIADLLEDQNASLPSKEQLSFVELTSKTKESLTAELGPRVHVNNPLDYHTYIWGDLDKLTRCFTAMMSNNFDLNVLIVDYPSGGSDQSWQVTEQALIAAVRKTGQRAVIVATLPENMPESARHRLQAAGIAPMQGLSDLLLAAHHALTIGQALRAGAPQPVQVIRSGAMHGLVNGQAPVADERSKLELGQALTKINGQLSGQALSELNGQALNEFRSKQLLELAGLAIPKSTVCSADVAAQIASEIGFPVVVKASAEDIVHKSEIQAVHLDLISEQAVNSAALALAQSSPTVLVEKMIVDSVAELIIGVARDELFGSALLVGFGGVTVELNADVVHLLLPLRASDVREALSRLKGYPLLTGFRGGPEADIDAIVDSVILIEAFLKAMNGQVEELDINPLIVRRSGQGVVVADAWMRITDSITTNSGESVQ